MSHDEIPGLNELLAEVFDHCEADGLVLPWIVTALAPNGSVLVVRMRGDGTPADVLAEHYEGGVFIAPMTIVVLDQRNEAAKVVIEATGKRTWS